VRGYPSFLPQESADGVPKSQLVGHPVVRKRQASGPNSTSTGVRVSTSVLNFNLPFEG
jgi:hypothetical protein